MTEPHVDRRRVMACLAAAPWLGAAPALATPEEWVALGAEPFRGKQDDVFFVDEMTGWYGNGLGRLYRTLDGGKHWTRVLDRPGAFVRALGFLDREVGFLGNIGPGYFPNVTDEVALYRTRNGGEAWEPVSVEGAPMKGVCAIDILRPRDAGADRSRWTVRAAGRVGGPAQMATSLDGGQGWIGENLDHVTAMILDIHFVDERVGFICGATDSAVQQSRALILRTADAGRTWTPVYQGDRSHEITWKMSWPSASVGYVTIQSYDPDPSASRRYVARSTDGGLNWRELPLVDDPRVRPFGVGFVDERRGWVGAAPHGFGTRDGGATWTPVQMGPAVNKIRVVPKSAGGFAVIAIGSELHRLDLDA